MSIETPPERADFIREIVAADVRSGRHSTIVTRFPPEPNGYLHIGHAKSICLNFGVARDFGGRCHLRFDDTNPVKEEQEYIDAIEHDIHWLGFDWGEHLHHASDYFEQLYDWAVHLIRNGDAYVDDLSADEIREHRGTLTEPGRNSPWRDRLVDENLDLFARMRAGEFPNGARVLRAKIDMASPNINLRDPVLYRILHAAHPRTGDAWRIYPTYDFAHGQSDAIEGVTHSICTLEFEAHRPLYDWLIEHLPVPSRPRQYEFARLNLTYTVLSKRFLLRLVDEGRVRGWDDPRMPTISGLRRRGFPAEGIRDFAEMVGVTKADSVIEYGLLEHAVRAVLNRTAPRRFGVLDPLKVVIENYPDDGTEEVEVPNNPEDPAAGTRPVPFGRELWIERDDFMEEPAPKFFRLAPGREVRLRSAYFITCQDVVKDAAGRVTELRCTYDPETRGGDAPDGRRPKATLHWVSVASAVPAEVRLYDHLYTRPDPGASDDLLADLNPNSETVVDRRVRGAVTGRGRARRDGPVRASRLLRRRSRLAAGPARVQPDADAQGHLGKGPGPSLSGPAGGPTCSAITVPRAARPGGSRSSMTFHGTRRCSGSICTCCVGTGASFAVRVSRIAESSGAHSRSGMPSQPAEEDRIGLDPAAAFVRRHHRHDAPLEHRPVATHDRETRSVVRPGRRAVPDSARGHREGEIHGAVRVHDVCPDREAARVGGPRGICDPGSVRRPAWADDAPVGTVVRRGSAGRCHQRSRCSRRGVPVHEEDLVAVGRPEGGFAAIALSAPGQWQVEGLDPRPIGVRDQDVAVTPASNITVRPSGEKL